MLAEVVVHRGVEHVPAQPVPRGLPHLADEQDVGIYGLYGAAEGPPEAVVHLAGHIEPPAVYAELLHPVPAHGAEIVPDLAVRRVQLRHHALIGVAGIRGVGLPVLRALHGEAQAVKPRAAARALLVLYHVLKGAEVPAAVVEHAVDYNADAPGVQGVHHGA